MISAPPAGPPQVDPETPADFPAVPIPPGPADPRALAGLCDRVRDLLADGPTRTVVCDVGAIRAPGLGHVELLARLELAAHRGGGRIRLRDPAPALAALLALVGLRFQVEGQTEEGEPAGGVQEAVETGDPAV
ncbi:STAS domain-containing protein [Streptomyces sp. DSM 110735]|uniref:STAS domain-containing protein n=1 Tax=Streptomyces sp. DSM 110735 TaxID=2775031 RepID=UPI0018F2B2FA|nr:STAS domain-containing protein [Streptomyces sp. DSM 110735]MBJ7907074.1 STAS domain-containing protein [Streptomyces sp. DSM 110735]